MSTKAPKSMTFRTVPFSSMPTFRSLMSLMSLRSSGLGSSSRGSRPGFSSSAMMSRSVGTPIADPVGERRDAERLGLGAQRGKAAGRRLLKRVAAGGEQRLRRRVRFRMDAGVVEQVAAFRHAQEARALLEAFGPSFGTFLSWVRAVNAPFSCR